MVEIGEVFHEPLVHQLLHQLLTQPVDIHGPLGGEMADLGLELGGAGDAHAPVIGLSRQAHHGRPADGAPVGEDETPHAGVPLRGDHLDHLGDDAPRPLDDDPVADADVLPLDLVGVVERGAADDGSLHLYRLHDGHGGKGPGASHLDDDVKDLGHLLAGGKLVGDGPAGAAGDFPEAALEVEGVDLDDDAVHLVGEFLPDLQHVVVIGDGLLDAVAPAGAGIGLQSEFRLGFQDLPVGLEGKPLHDADAVEVDVQGPRGGDAGIQLAEGSRRRVPGIGELRQAFLPSLFVQLFKPLDGHEDLPPGVEPRGEGQGVRPEFQGNGPDGADVVRHVFAGGAVPPGGAPGEDPAFVADLDGQAVHLGFPHVVDGLVRLEHPADPAVEFPDLPVVEPVGEAQHGKVVADRLEGFQGRGAHPPGGGVGRGQPGVAFLQLHEPAHHPVVFRVGNLRVVQHIIAIVVVVQRLPELFHLFSHGFGNHHGPSLYAWRLTLSRKLTI